MSAASRAKSNSARFNVLDLIERGGNALPHPITMFAMLAGIVLVISWITELMGVSAIHPRDGSVLAAQNLLDREGIARIFTEAVSNFTGFAPLGTVLVAMLGVGIAEASGLIRVLLRAFASNVPKPLLTAAIMFAGIQASMAGDAGIIILPPLAAMLFIAAGRHPLVGIAVAYASVSGGFSANLLPTVLDVLLVGLSQAALDSSGLLPNYQVNILGNYWFMIVSTPLLTVLGTWVTHRFVEPRMGRWDGTAAPAEGADPEDFAAQGERAAAKPLEREEKRGMALAGVSVLVSLGVMFALSLPPGAPLRTEGVTLVEQLRPLFDSLVVWVMIVFLVPGIVYGVVTRRIRSNHDAARMAGDTMATMGIYIALAFFAGQFVAWFGWSNLGAILAISGANTLKAMGLEGGPLLAGLVLFASILNLFTASSSAKWAVMSTVFVPMFVLLGFTPEATQCVYRVGDSCTNMVTPLMPYMPFLLAYAQRYDRKAGVGTLISMMTPYMIAFILMWTALLLVFWYTGLPIGPGVGMRLG